MTSPDTIPSQKLRLPWSLRGKVEVGQIQLIGQNAAGLPYLQGHIRNRTGRALRLRIVARVLNEQQQPIFSGSPGILETIELEGQQQRAFRISLSDVHSTGQNDRQRLWVTRSAIELSIEQ